MAATPGLRSAVAPGSIVSIFGQVLADGLTVAAALPLPRYPATSMGRAC